MGGDRSTGTAFRQALIAAREQLRPAVVALAILTVVTGALFPAVLGGAAALLFPRQAGGSLVTRHGVVVGADPIGQAFAAPRYFHSRPSAAGTGYDASSSGGSNLGPSNPKARPAAAALATAYRAENGLTATAVIPVDAVTASGSGLDPDISPANARLQVARVARARGLTPDTVARLVADHVRGRQLGVLGSPRVAVLALNLALDRGDRPVATTGATTDSVGPAGRWAEYALFTLIVLALAWPAGHFLARVFERTPTALDRVLGPVERAIYRLSGIRADREMTAGVYIACFVGFGVFGALLLAVILLAQTALPGGPADRFLTTPMTGWLAANTAISFATTTTWQAYGGETTLRYLSQLIGLTAQNFLAGAAGLAVGIAFIRGFARAEATTLGNFWVDLIRAVLWVLVPLALILGLVMVAEGVPLNLAAYTPVTTLAGVRQTIAQGPVAALEGIKQLGTNGGGFFNANGAHPYANPTPLTNFVTLLAIVGLPAALTVTFGVMTGRMRSGLLLLGVMGALFVGGLVIADLSEAAPPPQFAGLHIAGGNMEGKEVRFGVGGSVLAAVVTSNGATGSYNSMHDSYRPLGVGVPLVNMLLGEIVFGGLGTGLYAMVMIALIAVFLGGLMIGRTPEYLGKRVRPDEAKLVVTYALIGPVVILALTALAIATDAGRAGLTTNAGPRGFTEILYAYASAMANNGQNLAGLNANTPFYNATTIVAMLAGRFGLTAVALAVAGRFAAQGRRAESPGSLPSDTPVFAVLLIGTIIVLGGLTFLPALVFGPLAEGLG